MTIISVLFPTYSPKTTNSLDIMVNYIMVKQISITSSTHNMGERYLFVSTFHPKKNMPDYSKEMEKHME